ncbi:P-loop containing nucleoside triphosphate hydrolase protein [Vararia minispora EC-137]|uniref:P-loop containing nucleoside triphosphate hydrolase protein n=1 Tax=Vararia minispora EC-137 TaxID=1314806 RepID=A0ACB8QX84_9AGAM|nr:P-loop containing nucleoside triphosphate hydrolase protein [Vararia minispora EC-137]
MQRVYDVYSNPDRSNKISDKARAGVKTLEKLGHKGLVLDEHEREIAAEIIHPDDIDVKFSDIAGLEDIISSLQESVIFPLVHPTIFGSSSSLLAPPKGVLLYGPPGCGKTMLAKAMAKESGATFINIAASVLTNKWFGESNKLVAALFRLARKTQPSIVFIDEIDSFLRERDRGDHEATGMMKAEFMTLWDGLLSGSDRILILGATNRMQDIDAAFLRRMPKRFSVPLPDIRQREKILRLMLKDFDLAPDLPLGRLADCTTRFSSSDLKELCRNAAMVPIRELYRDSGGNVEALKASQGEKGYTLRPLVLSDFANQDGIHIQVDEPQVDEPLD